MKIIPKHLNAAHITVAWCDMQTDNYKKNFVENIEDADVQAVVTLESPQVLWDYLQTAFERPLSMWYWIIAEGRVILSGSCDDSTDPEILREYFGDAIDFGDWFGPKNDYKTEF